MMVVSLSHVIPLVDTIEHCQSFLVDSPLDFDLQDGAVSTAGKFLYIEESSLLSQRQKSVDTHRFQVRVGDAEFSFTHTVRLSEQCLQCCAQYTGKCIRKVSPYIELIAD